MFSTKHHNIKVCALTFKKECYASSIVPPSSSLTFIIENQYLDRYSVSFEHSLPVRNSEDLKSVIAPFISLLGRNLAMWCSFGKQHKQENSVNYQTKKQTKIKNMILK